MLMHYSMDKNVTKITFVGYIFSKTLFYQDIIHISLFFIATNSDTQMIEITLFPIFFHFGPILKSIS